MELCLIVYYIQTLFFEKDLLYCIAFKCCVYVHGSQKGELDPLELELQKLTSCSMQVLRSKLWSSDGEEVPLTAEPPHLEPK